MLPTDSGMVANLIFISCQWDCQSIWSFWAPCELKKTERYIVMQLQEPYSWNRDCGTSFPFNEIGVPFREQIVAMPIVSRWVEWMYASDILAPTMYLIAYCINTRVKVYKSLSWIRLRQSVKTWRARVKLFVLSGRKVVDLADWWLGRWDSSGYLFAWPSVMLTKDSLYAIVLDNGRTIVITGTLLSEIDQRPCRLQIIFSYFVFPSKIHKRWLIS